MKNLNTQKNKKTEDYMKVILEALHSELPAPLNALKFKRIAAGIIIGIIAVISAIYIKNISCLLIILLAVYMIMIAFKVNYDFYTGNIKEQKLCCISSKIRKSGIDIVFVDADEATYVLSYSDKRKVFYENVMYYVYTKKSMPKVILACDEENSN